MRTIVALLAALLAWTTLARAGDGKKPAQAHLDEAVRRIAKAGELAKPATPKAHDAARAELLLARAAIDQALRGLSPRIPAPGPWPPKPPAGFAPEDEVGLADIREQIDMLRTIRDDITLSAKEQRERYALLTWKWSFAAVHITSTAIRRLDNGTRVIYVSAGKELYDPLTGEEAALSNEEVVSQLIATDDPTAKGGKLDWEFAERLHKGDRIVVLIGCEWDGDRRLRHRTHVLSESAPTIAAEK